MSSRLCSELSLIQARLQIVILCLTASNSFAFRLYKFEGSSGGMHGVSGHGAIIHVGYAPYMTAGAQKLGPHAFPFAMCWTTLVVILCLN